jgi:hypothetical protein
MKQNITNNINSLKFINIIKIFFIKFNNSCFLSFFFSLEPLWYIYIIKNNKVKINASISTI